MDIKTEIQHSVIGSIRLMADDAVSKASYDKTVKAQIVECKDKAIGEYIVKYKDIPQTAYSITPGIKYEKDQYVFITIPKNDSNAVKTILGPIDHLVTSVDQKKTTDELYNVKGPNLLKKIVAPYYFRYKFSSYKDEVKTIYDKNSTNNEVAIDDRISQYFAQGDSLILKMNVQTMLMPEQKASGQYGIIYTMTFLNEGTEEEIQKTYMISHKDVIGNPYEVGRKTTVYHLENIDGKNFKSIDKIEVFCKGFPVQKDNGEQDVRISQISLQSAATLSEEESTGYSLDIDYSTNGSIFYTDSKDKTKSVTEILLKGIPKIKGVPITSKVKYYWFRENGLVFQGKKGYSFYGGNGWECLNPYAKDKYIGVKDNNIYFTTDQNNSHYKAYKKDTLKDDEKDDYKTITVLDKSSKNIKIKCVAKYENTVIATGQTIIHNDNIQNELIYITSSDGEKRDYYYNNGRPSLTCHVKKDQDSEEDFTFRDSNYKWETNKYDWHFIWSIENADGCLELDQTKITLPKFYQAQNGYKQFKKVLARVEKTAQKNWENTHITQEAQDAINLDVEIPDNDYTQLANKYLKIKKAEIVDHDTYFHVNIGNIKEYSKFICGVERKPKGSSDNNYVYMGTASITLYNHMTSAGEYSLNLVNGSQIFQYDDDGKSPCLSTRERPYEISPLGFILTDNEGEQISYEKILKNGEIYWCIPKEDTLLIPPDGNYEKALPYLSLLGNVRALAADDTWAIYSEGQSFSFSIADTFDSQKLNNNIRLYVVYKNLIFDTYTNFTFPKTGDPGTNGTPYFARICPIDDKENIITTDRVYIKTTGDRLASTESYDFYADGGQSINNVKFELYNADNTALITEANNWEFPTKGNPSYFKWDKQDKKIKLSSSIERDQIDKTGLEYLINPVNILRASYGKDSEPKYYAELPINYINIRRGDYRIKVRQKTGFIYVVYDNDGTHPQYDNSKPFEIVLEKKQGDYYIEQIPSNYTFGWRLIGDGLVLDSQEGNIATIKPASKYNGQTLYNAIKVSISGIGFIYIPIYLMLNRYGYKALNDWDGNSIDLGEDSGIILAPQIGAGKKNVDDNSFSGVLMGTMKVGKKEQTGFLGFDHGARTIFLDSDTGKAEFGKNGAGKVIIDPHLKVGKDTNLNNSTRKNFKDAGLLYSGNYTLPTSTVEDGISYHTLDVSKYHPGEGMIIDLSTPQIGFGSGNFYVTEKGDLHSETGTIGGWQITPKTLQSTNDKGGVFLSSDNSSQNNKAIRVLDAVQNKDIFSVDYSGKVYAEAGTIAGWNVTQNWFHKGYTGVNSNADTATTPAPAVITINGEATTQSKAFFANRNNFFVTHDGYLQSKYGKIANWNISTEALTNGHTGLGSTIAPLSAFGQSGSDTLHIWSGTDTGLNFAVTQDGRLYSRYGSIGGWNISSSMLYSGAEKASDGPGIRLYNNGNIQGGGKSSTYYNDNGTTYYKFDDGTTSTTKEGFWQINQGGSARFNNLTVAEGKIGKWTIKDDGIVGSGNNVILNSNGTITANKGSISGIEIYNDGLKSSNGNWYINSDGSAKFTNIVGLSGNAGGGTLSNGTLSDYTANPNNLYIDSKRKTSFGKYMNDLVSGSTGNFGKLIIDEDITYDNKTVKMESLYVGLSVRTEDFYAYQSSSSTTKKQYTLKTPIALVMSVGLPPTGCEYYCGIGYVLHGTVGWN